VSPHKIKYSTQPSVLIISATLSGLIVFENPRLVDGLPLSVMFDGQMWLGPKHILTSIFHYYNSSNDSSAELGHYTGYSMKA
jgi:hypothetical protein